MIYPLLAQGQAESANEHHTIEGAVPPATTAAVNGDIPQKPSR